MNQTYKNSTVVMAGLACLIVVSRLMVQLFCNRLNYDYQLWYWLSPVFSLSTPVLCGWVGILIRRKHPSPKIWVKAIVLALIPASYILWTVLHRHGIYLIGDGYRCMLLYSAILGYLIPPERLEEYARESGWLELGLFFCSAFCYWGITRVVDHFSVESYQMLDSDWIRLFTRAMRFVPLAMGIFFLAEFSFSRVGQSLGEKKYAVKLFKVLVILSFLTMLLFVRVYAGSTLLQLYRYLSQPVMVYALCVVGRIVRKWAGIPLTWKDVFSISI